MGITTVTGDNDCVVAFKNKYEMMGGSRCWCGCSSDRVLTELPHLNLGISAGVNDSVSLIVNHE